MFKKNFWIYTTYLMQFLIFAFLIVAISQKKYLVITGTLIALFITFIPHIIEKKWKLSLHWGLNFLIVLSLCFHTGGLVLNFYPTYSPFYDKFTHFLGSITVALLGFVSTIILEKYSKLRLKKIHIIIFIIIFTLSIGTLWEMGEFTIDKIFETKNQYSLNDTMYDLIFDLLGGITIALIVYLKFEIMKNRIKF